ncbi:DUF1983 domain-containing protein [Azospirillum sp. Sh1]|nr:DUF1983 domain-containing protein [Azospirillum sp. Sh1]
MAVAVAGALYTGGGSLALGGEAFAVAGYSVSWGSIALFGATMLLSGVSQMLTQTPKANTVATNASYLFSGPVNSTEQGDSVSLIYGDCWVGSTVISSGMDSDQTGSNSAIATQTTTAVSPPATGSKPIEGEKGGGKSGGSSGATEDPNSLQSKAKARVIDLLGEGEIVGLVDGAKSIYFDGVPLVGPDGKTNFNGVEWVERTGLPSQDFIPGFPAAETTVSVGVDVKTSVGPVTRTIYDADVNAARVALRWNAITEQDTKNGNLHGSSVRFTIEVRAANRGWQTAIDDTVTGKTTSTYERSYRLDLAAYGSAPYDIRVTRVTPDATATSVQNAFSWAYYTEIIDAKFEYPNSALIALKVNAEEFGSSVPARAYHVKGLKIKVPANYNPVARTYAGEWDGSFKVAWTNNPAWVLYDLLTNTRYGLGKSIPESAVDKWSLYSIAQYCDGPVKSGELDSTGADVMEPRFTFNGVISGRTEAYKVIQSIASTFRGLVFWSAGGVLARADMPNDPIKLVTPANVIDGKFTYSGTALKARHTAALITFNDPDDGYRSAIEIVENPEMVRQYGWRQTEATAYGCTRRSQARRLGLWMLDSEQNETETVTYQCSFDHLDVMPGDVVKVADPAWAAVRMGGRLRAYDDAQQVVTLDDTVTLEASQSYVLAITLPDGRLVDCPVRRPTPDSHTTDQLAIDAGPLAGAVPQPNAVWILTATNLAPRLFRVRAVVEKSRGIYEITALLHDPAKYARVENGVQLVQTATQAVNSIAAPADLSAVESVYWVNGLPQARLTVSWSTSADARISGYRAYVLTPGGQWQEWQVTRTCGFDVEPAAEGQYTIRVLAVTYDNRRSQPAEISVQVKGKGTPPGQPQGLVATGGLRQIALTWVNPSDTDLSYIEVLEAETNDLSTATVINTVKGNAFVRTGLGGLVTRYYWVRAVDLAGNTGDVNSNIGTGATTAQLSHDDLVDQVISQSKLVPILQQKITGIEKIAEAVAGGLVRINDSYGRIKQEIGRRESDVAEVKTDVQQLQDDTQSLTSQITTVTAQFDGQIAGVKEELTALATADETTAKRIDTVVATFGNNLAGLQSQLTATTSATQANAERIDSVVASFGQTLAGHDSRITAVADANGALTTRVDSLGASVDGVKSGLTSEQTARANADGALSQRIDSLNASLGSVSASLQTEITARANADGSLSQRVDTLNSTVGGFSTSIQQIASTTNGLAAQYTVKIDNNGYISGFGLASYDRGTAGRVSEFVVRADNFIVGTPGVSADYPFVIGTVNGQTRVSMSTAFIQDASIDAAKIRDATISRAKIQDLTINGQKIEDFATSNISAATGKESATVGLSTTGKRVLLIACRGWLVRYVNSFGESNQEYYRWQILSQVWVEQPGPGWNIWTTANADTGNYGGFDIIGYNSMFASIAALELRK